MADDIVKEAKDAFAIVQDAEHDNRVAALDDLKFARLGEQWPEDAVRMRGAARPRLTINKMPAFIRQVVNDARQNKPQIRVHPVDSRADPETAEIYNGLIRNIEAASNADIAYDTATECAVTMGFGYFRVDLRYAYEDVFDLDICIDRISNPFSVYGDPHSTAADSSDWNSAFVVEAVPKAEFGKRFKGASAVDWAADGYETLCDPWITEETVMVAEWWRREEYEKPIYLLSDGTIQTKEWLDENAALLAIQGVTIVNERTARCHRVKQYLLTGAEELEANDWVGKYIPIIPVYGEEVDVEGKRYFKSLIRDAKDAQRMFNYWRTTATELVALAPRVPYIGPKGAFKTDAAKWQTANTVNHPYLEYDGQVAPQRQPLDSGGAAGALQEALNASDDMKAIMGLYDASLGARSNETSGRAILVRQREGDVATFHFADNMARAIRHAGRVLLDLIPKVYDKARIVRTLGQDGTPSSVAINQPVPVTDESGQPVLDQAGQPMTRVYDLSAGKYDLTVTTGPSFTTRREEAATQMIEMMRAFPQAAPVIGDLVAKNLDWPGADEIAERLKAINPALKQQGQGIPPELQKQIQEGFERLKQLEQENQQLKAANEQLKAANELKAKEIEVKRAEVAVKAREAEIDFFRAQTERIQPPEPPKFDAA